MKRGDMNLLDEWQGRQDTLLWADFAGDDPDQEKQILLSKFGLHPMAIQDAQRDRHPPKIEQFDGYVFILLKGLGKETEAFEFETVQIAMFIGKRFLVTRHSGDSPSIEKLWQDVERDPALFAQGTDALALRLSRII